MKDIQNTFPGKYLITTDDWFLGPDGKSYKAAWGSVEILEDAILGVKTNRNSTNWYAMIGSEERHVIVAGCQIHYAVRCDEEPDTSLGYEVSNADTERAATWMFSSAIYIAE